MNISKIDDPNDVKNNVLRDRAERNRGGMQEFLAIVDETECGFLAFGDWSHYSLGFIHEIFVLPEFRGLGLGGSLLSYAEQLAVRLGCTCVRLEVRSLDREKVSDEFLTSWYLRNGYVPRSDEKGQMEKCFVRTDT
jgi:GNAT superfamily N-acetyltransferase